MRLVYIAKLPSSSYDIGRRPPVISVLCTSVSFSENEKREPGCVVEYGETLNTIEFVCGACTKSPSSVMD